jgi:hypothetical protein
MKKWYQSRIIILNIISVLLEVGNLLMTNPIIPAKFAGTLTLIVNFLNIMLRMVTNTSIGRGEPWGVKNSVGDWLVSYSGSNPIVPVWGTKLQAMQFTEQAAKDLAVNIGPGTVAVPIKN